MRSTCSLAVLFALLTAFGAAGDDDGVARPEWVPGAYIVPDVPVELLGRFWFLPRSIRPETDVPEGFEPLEAWHPDTQPYWVDMASLRAFVAEHGFRVPSFSRPGVPSLELVLQPSGRMHLEFVGARDDSVVVGAGTYRQDSFEMFARSKPLANLRETHAHGEPPVPGPHVGSLSITVDEILDDARLFAGRITVRGEGDFVHPLVVVQEDGSMRIAAVASL